MFYKRVTLLHIFIIALYVLDHNILMLCYVIFINNCIYYIRGVVIRESCFLL